MEVPVGPFMYKVKLVDRLINHSGRECLGSCNQREQCIFISSVSAPQKRLAVFWHEVAHAWLVELGTLPKDKLNHESIADLVGLGMAPFTPEKFTELHDYVTGHTDP